MIIGIDPDIHKSGIAILYKDNSIKTECLNFAIMLNLIRGMKPLIKSVYIEAGWYNKKSNWHSSASSSIAGRIGKNVGENHATGKLLAQCIEHEGIKVVLVKPTKSKLNAEQFKKLTGIQHRTNQEQRDATMLIFGMKS